jgi:hypothetical protein
MKYTLLLSAFALVGGTSVIAGPSDAAAFAIRAANERAATQAVASSEVKYVATNHSKGGSTIAQARDNQAASIALMKSKKDDSCSSCKGGSCKAR